MAFARAVDAPMRAALRSWIGADLARLPPPGASAISSSAHCSAWKLIGALADVVDAADDVDGYCAAARCRQRRGSLGDLLKRLADFACLSRRLIPIRIGPSIFWLPHRISARRRSG
jgi:hypothetical protein